MIINQEIKEINDNQKLLSVYIPIILDLYKNIELSYNEIKKHLLIEFNHDVKLEDIILYFEPNLYEDQIDIQQQINNLGIVYE